MISESEDTKNPRLTVVVPITLMSGRLFNLEEWLHLAIKLPIQVLIIHDVRDVATSEELAALVNELNSRNIEIVEGLYGNPGSARNQGIIRARGEWISFWDSDDSPCVDLVMLEIENSPITTDVIVGAFTVFDEAKGVNSESYTASNPREIAMNPGVWRMIFRTTSIEKFRFPSLRMAEDQVFLSKILFAELQIRYTSRTLYKYYVGNSAQLTNSKDALADLPRAILETGIRNQTVELNQLKFDMFLIARQMLTSFAKARTAVKIAAIVAILRVSRRNSLIAIKYLSQSILYILLRKTGWKTNERE